MRVACAVTINFEPYNLETLKIFYLHDLEIKGVSSKFNTVISVSSPAILVIFFTNHIHYKLLFFP